MFQLVVYNSTCTTLHYFNVITHILLSNTPGTCPSAHKSQKLPTCPHECALTCNTHASMQSRTNLQYSRFNAIMHSLAILTLRCNHALPCNTHASMRSRTPCATTGTCPSAPQKTSTPPPWATPRPAAMQAGVRASLRKKTLRSSQTTMLLASR